MSNNNLPNNNFINNECYIYTKKMLKCYIDNFNGDTYEFYLVLGPMCSGKTDLLIDLYYYVNYIDNPDSDRILTMKPILDSRNSDIVSRSGRQVPCTLNVEAFNPDTTSKSIKYIFIDEVQFASPSSVSSIIKFAYINKCQLFVFGLNSNYLGIVFNTVNSILPHFHQVFTLSSVCQKCNISRTPYTFRIKGVSRDLICINDDIYICQCLNCFSNNRETFEMSSNSFSSKFSIRSLLTDDSGNYCSTPSGKRSKESYSEASECAELNEISGISNLATIGKCSSFGSNEGFDDSVLSKCDKSTMTTPIDSAIFDRFGRQHLVHKNYNTNNKYYILKCDNCTERVKELKHENELLKDELYELKKELTQLLQSKSLDTDSSIIV